MDSATTLGSFAHGRSSSPHLSRVQQGALPYILGGGLYLGGLQTPTDIHRADDPTRHQPVRKPDHPLPEWAADIQQRHSFSRFDVVAAADFLPRPLCFWARFILLLGLSSCIAAMDPRHMEGTFASVNRSASPLEGQTWSDADL